MLKHLAVDIGASSGRLMLGQLQNGQLLLKEMHRFKNGSVEKDGRLVWENQQLFAEIIKGLKKCKEANETPDTIGIDTWGVDYALLDEDGQLMGQTVAYRDSRTKDMDKYLERTLSYDEYYAIAGIAKQPFNTIYQLLAEDKQTLSKAKTFLMMPDYLNFLLTGIKANEYTNASTTGLLNASTRTWDQTILAAAGIDPALFSAPLLPPASLLGPLSGAIAKEVGFTATVILPATHDTGSAYMAVPARDENAVYLSSGTWSLLGIETDTPYLAKAAMEAGFTNEGGYGGKIRLLKNIMGLWLLQSLRTQWMDQFTFAQMADLALEGKAYKGTFDANDPSLLAPESMLEAIASLLKKGGHPLPENQSQWLYAVYQSLALCYRDAIRDLENMTGKHFNSMNIVGGGSNNRNLNQMIADHLGIPVYAGPSEGTALGNVIAQLIATKEVSSLQQARDMIKTSFDINLYTPKED